MFFFRRLTSIQRKVLRKRQQRRIYWHQLSWERERSRGADALRRGEYKESIHHYLESLRAARGISEENKYYALSCLSAAAPCRKSGDHKAAANFIDKGLSILEKLNLTFTPEYAEGLCVLGRLERDKGRYCGAEDIIRKALAIFKQTTGRENKLYIRALGDLADVLRLQGKHRKARPLLKKVFSMYKKIPGDNHYGTAVILIRLSALNEAGGKFSAAAGQLKAAMEILEKSVGQTHVYYAAATCNLALLYGRTGNFDSARIEAEKAICLYREIYGEHNPEFIRSYHILASLYCRQGEYEKASAVYRKQIDLMSGLRGENHPDYARCLLDLANLYMEMDAFSCARQLYKKASLIIEAGSGKDNVDYGIVLCNMATMLVSYGNHAEAVTVCAEAGKILFNPEHGRQVYVFNHINALIRMYILLGEYGKADQLSDSYLLSMETEKCRIFPFYADILMFKAIIARNRKNYARADHFFQLSLDFISSTAGNDHPAYARNLYNRGELNLLRQDYARGKSYFYTAKQCLEQSRDMYHADYAKVLVGLSKIYLHENKIPKARSFCRRALEVTGKAFSERHREFAHTLLMLAHIEDISGNFGTAMDLYLQAAGINNSLILQLLSVSNEKNINEYIGTFKNEEYLMLSAFYRHADSCGETCVRTIFNHILYRKTMALQLMMLRREILEHENDREAKKTQQNLCRNRIALAHLLTSGTGDINNGGEDRLRRIESLEKDIEADEKELAARVPCLQVEKQRREANYKTIAARLPGDSCLMEYVWFESYEPTTGVTPRYLAFVLFPEEEVLVLDIGPACELNALIAAFRKEIGTRSTEGGEHGIKLYHKLLHPLLSRRNDMKKIFIAADADLTLLPFGALPLPDGTFAVETYNISYLDSGLDLLRHKSVTEPQSGALVISSPDYDLVSERGCGEGEVETKKISGCLLWGKRDLGVTGAERVPYFPPLSGAAEEGAAIASILNLPPEQVLQGPLASEYAIKKIRGPVLLHVATHGFFISGEEQDADFLLPRFFHLDAESASFRKVKENPLLRCGLALAGANVFLKTGKFTGFGENGMLSALDVTGMDLNGTDLVVLSACETGLGDTIPGEGIYGLRRSFILAGAKTLIASLWKVPDCETRELMITFYRKIKEGKTKAGALLESQRELIRRYRKEGKEPHPSLWGAFICLGDPGKAACYG